jgi:pimeloyl-ACP methyl ester carboxylesterase
LPHVNQDLSKEPRGLKFLEIPQRHGNIQRLGRENPLATISKPLSLELAPQTWRGLRRGLRGCLSALSSLASPCGYFFSGRLRALATPRRLRHGYTIVLPGIEGESLLNQDIAWGLADVGLPHAIEIYDWTTRNSLSFISHLRSWHRNRQQASQIAARIQAYQTAYPARPVHLIGHSGGGALALLALAALPSTQCVTSAILLAPAVSRSFNLTAALRRTEWGIWNFSTPLDILYLRAATCVVGTLDRRYTVAAGASGFSRPEGLTPAERELYQSRLHERPYHLRMAASFNLGGHFGCTNRVFAAEWLAPLLCEHPSRVE